MVCLHPTAIICLHRSFQRANSCFFFTLSIQDTLVFNFIYTQHKTSTDFLSRNFPLCNGLPSPHSDHLPPQVLPQGQLVLLFHFIHPGFFGFQFYLYPTQNKQRFFIKEFSTVQWFSFTLQRSSASTGPCLQYPLPTMLIFTQFIQHSLSFSLLSIIL